METYKINHELNEHNYIEEATFIGLMPEVMNATGVKTIGGSSKSSKNFGIYGSDPLEVIDIEAFYDSEEEGEKELTFIDSSGKTIGTGSGKVRPTEGIGKKVDIDNFDKNEDYEETPDISKGSTRYFDLIDDETLSSGKGKTIETISKQDISYQLYKMDNDELVETDVWMTIDNE